MAERTPQSDDLTGTDARAAPSFSLFDEPAAGPSAPRVFSIAAGRPFLDVLAHWLLASIPHEDPFALADATILLPTRRAARALADAFARQAGGRHGQSAMLLPRIETLGDIDEDEMTLADAGAELALDLPAAIDPVRRRLVLARMVAARDAAERGEASWPAALSAADALGQLLDSLQAEDIPFSALQNVTPERYAGHWARSLDFLKIIGEVWPHWLNEHNAMDAAARRRMLIEARAEAWRATPPKGPVIAAGSTGSMPAVAALMGVIARLPKGCVVLPALDLGLDEAGWRDIDDPHPQRGLKLLLERTEKGLAANRGDVSELPLIPDESAGREDAPHGHAARRRLLSLALRPAKATDAWREGLDALGPDAIKEAATGLSIVEADDEEGEASAIALLMREALETPEKTATLVTPDRNLARRVEAALARWDVAVDDSAGRPFSQTPLGAFLRLTVRWLTDPGAPAALIPLLQHPACNAGRPRAETQRAARALDLALRGPRPGADFQSLRTHAEKREDAGINALLGFLAPLAADISASGAEARLSRAINAAETLHSDGRAGSGAALWSGAEGEAGAGLLARLAGGLSDLGDIPDADWPHLFDGLIAGTPVRRRAPAHPRLSIMGPLEARLHRADRIILGGLNEATWPGDAGVDPFLSRPMRAEAGLPSPERRIGLAAHDFFVLAAGAETFLTRSKRRERAPARPSRWFVRLRNLLIAAEKLDDCEASAKLLRWTGSLDAPKAVAPARPPQPRPPVALRPRKLYVTDIGRLIRDPYAIYAKHILRLRELDALEAMADQRLKGVAVHTLAEAVAAIDVNARDADERLQELMERTLEEAPMNAGAAAIWRHRLVRAGDFLLATERDLRARGAPAVVEKKGVMTMAAPAGPYEIAARADRIDQLHDGGFAVFDFKTGRAAKEKEISSGLEPQLPLEALIAEAGGFEGLNGPARRIAFIRLHGGGEGGEIVSDISGAELVKILEGAREGAGRLIAQFDDPATPYLSQPRARFKDAYGAYDQLARRKEWSTAGEDGGDEQ